MFRAGNIVAGLYQYMPDLLALESHGPSTNVPRWPRVHTPVQIGALSLALAYHPDQTFASYILKGFTEGFHIGFNRRQVRLRSSLHNHPSALANSAIVDSHILTEVEAGRLVGPIVPWLVPQVHRSPIGLVPKAHQAGKWRLIVDLSAPPSASTNDGIATEQCSLKYTSVDEAVQMVLQLSRGSRLIKIDLKNAYRIVPIHPDDQHLLAISWNGGTYIDRALPFGLRSAPKIFTAVADAIAWALHCAGVEHQLDDFLFFVPPAAGTGSATLTKAMQVLQNLGIPVATHKTEGPSCIVTFLGILIDTQSLQLRLPPEKLSRLQSLVQSWQRKRAC